MDRSSAPASPELQRVLANIRVLIAIVATIEATSLSLSTRTPLVFASLTFAAYAGWLCWVELRGSGPRFARLTLWLDTASILIFASLAAGKSSLFVLMLLFPVLFASLSFGFASGMLVSAFAAAVTAAQVAAQSQPGDALPVSALLQLLSVLVLGPLLVGLARAGVQMNEQRAISGRLLDEADPRLGVERVAETVLRALVSHFDADRGLLLLWLPESEPRLFRCDADGAVAEPQGELRAPLHEALARLPAGVAAVHNVGHLFGRVPIRYHAGIDLATESPTDAARTGAEELAEMLGAASLMALPVCRRAPHPCRLVLESRSRHYRPRDADLLASVMEQIAPVIENAGLLERLTEAAMATERARIGRDLHDTAVQPYLGLKYGIEALARKAGADNPLKDDLCALQEIATDELHELRELVSGMRSGAQAGDERIGEALRRQAKRFTELFGIDVVVSCPDKLAVNRRTAATISPIVSEALTNIRRHSDATRADIELSEEDGGYLLRIGNACDGSAPAVTFVPRSIVERAESVQGRAVVDVSRAGFTDLMISIPKTS